MDRRQNNPTGDVGSGASPSGSALPQALPDTTHFRVDGVDGWRKSDVGGEADGTYRLVAHSEAIPAMDSLRYARCWKENDSGMVTLWSQHQGKCFRRKRRGGDSNPRYSF